MDGWNLACEILPNDGDRVLVYVEHPIYRKEKDYVGDITIAEYWHDKWKCKEFLGNEVIAWKQLPDLPIPFDDPKPDDGCWNCMNFDWKHEACTLNWNNLDESYYNPDTDDRDLTDCCEYHETDPDADWKEIFGGDE